MNVLKIVACSTVIACFTAQASLAIAEDDSLIYGTHRVVFQPIRSSGVLQGCSLVYTAVIADHVYKNGSLVAINGNVSIYQGGKKGGNVGLNLKIGINDFVSPKASFSGPYFAYLQTENETTAKSLHEAFDGENGYRFFVFHLNEASTKLIVEMVDTGKVTIAFNRKKGGIDVLVPVDLTVIDAEYQGEGNVFTGKVVRKHSNEGPLQFLSCVGEVLEQAKQAISHLK